MTSRRTIGILLLLASLYLLFVAVSLISETVQPPEPGAVFENFNAASISFEANTVKTLFNGDCIQLSWNVTGDSVREVYIADAPVTGSGERQHCDATMPRLRIVFTDDTSQEWSIPVHAAFDQPRTYVLFLPAIICAVIGGFLLRVHYWRVWQRPLVQYALAFVFAVAWVFLLDLFTNSLNIYRYVWDHYHYIDMAEHGIVGNPGLVAPFAYRPIPPLLAGFIGGFAGRSVIAGFRVITYIGMISQLVLTFALARQFTRKRWVAWVVMAVVGLSTYNVKFLLFDIYRPDSLAYSLILVGILAFIQRNRFVGARRALPLQNPETPDAPQQSPPLHNMERGMGGEVFFDFIILVLAAFGLLVREFCALPAALLAFRLLRDYLQALRIRYLLEMVIVVAVVAAAYWLPRQIITVARSTQLVDVTEGGIFGIVFNLTHDFNVVFGVAIYLLPQLILLTPQRARRLWARLQGIRADLILYTLIVLALTLIGGTDISRFAVYLFVPLIVMMAILLDEGVHPVEVAYMLLATAIYNRIVAPVPQENLDTYLDFLIVWDNRISGHTLLRGVELLAWIAGAFTLRWLAARNTARRSNDV